ncbi:YibE/F family protein [Staphylococcus haemolyticus]|nr:YibE/F family protein [Staphylococcus haemolyticus]
MGVGREIVATCANRIYLGYFGGELRLLFWFLELDYCLGDMIK